MARPKSASPKLSDNEVLTYLAGDLLVASGGHPGLPPLH